MNAFGRFILNRLKEATTYAGLVGILAAMGVSISPDQKEAIIAFGVALASAILVFFPNTFGENK